MAIEKLQVERSAHDGGIEVFTLTGDLVGDGDGYAFQDAVRARVSDRPRAVVLDFTHVVRIDSCGIGILAALVVSARNAGVKIVFACLSERAKKLLAVVWPMDFVDSADTLDEAMDKARA